MVIKPTDGAVHWCSCSSSAHYQLFTVKEGPVGCLEPALAAARLDTCPAVALSKGFIPQLPALLSPIFRWLKDVAPGQGTIELPPQFHPRQRQSVLVSGAGSAAACDFLSGSSLWTSSRGGAEGNSFQLLEVRASLSFEGSGGDFFACGLRTGISHCCFLNSWKNLLFLFKDYPVRHTQKITFCRGVVA